MLRVERDDLGGVRLSVDSLDEPPSIVLGGYLDMDRVRGVAVRGCKREVLLAIDLRSADWFDERVLGRVDPDRRGSTRWTRGSSNEALRMSGEGRGEHIARAAMHCSARPWWTTSGVSSPMPE